MSHNYRLAFRFIPRFRQRQYGRDAARLDKIADENNEDNYKQLYRTNVPS